VASILEAFQTDAFRRVKVGVGQPEVILDRVQYVLSPFDPASRAAVQPAISAATARAPEVAPSAVVEPF
jgi:peptidyl-tRNA hydrolase